MATKSGEQLLYQDTTYKIRGACFKIWKEFGGAFKETIIDRALTEELRKQNLTVENQKRIDIYYGGKKVGTYVPDKIINDSVLIELKCKPFLTREDRRQFWLYLKATKYRVGFLINFGASRLEIKRIVYDKARKFPRESA
ncbi:MAG: GxxExxY protein [Candidatus Sungiibacteriota bacterium]